MCREECLRVLVDGGGASLQVLMMNGRVPSLCSVRGLCSIHMLTGEPCSLAVPSLLGFPRLACEL